MIKKYISDSLKAQEKLDNTECEKEKKELTGNPLIVSNAEPPSFIINTVKTGGFSRKMVEFTTSDRHAIGIYHRCVSDIEGMDSAVKKLKAMPNPSKLNHKKVQLLKSYTKHYGRFQLDHGMLKKFKNLKEDLKEQFIHSHDTVGRREWKKNLDDWDKPGFPMTPADYQKIYDIYP